MDEQPFVRGVSRNWTLFLVRGIAAILFGIVALVFPRITVGALVILFAVYAILDGIASLVSAVRHREDAIHRLGHVVEGLVGIAIGVLALLLPDVTAFVLVVLIGVWAIATGVAEIVAAYRLRREITNEWFLVVSGVLSIAAGVLILLRPDAGAVAIAVVIGIYAILFGAFLVALALRLRSIRRALPPPIV